ncbi:ZAR1-like protein [Bufo gargarizans]|uniref:ZAR1-like protein n=1 Tax=Bufo gargarizans TaxID=30331 RepID=UPI001CF529FC|nr:ZAR1-like protein [Bufo gargarizans]
MAGFMCTPYNAYHSYGGSFGQAPPGTVPQPPARNKQAAWKTGKGSEAADYLDNFQRAQLKAILSQVNPNLTPRLRKANTKEVGVQVNPRVDAGVQCSLGPRTLRRPPVSAAKAEPVRFTRPVAVYSPVVDGRVFSLPQGGRTIRKSPAVPDYKEAEEQLQESAERRPEAEPEQREPAREKEPDHNTAAFQFLEQKYGYFHCKDCKTRWESAYVWCISGSNKVYFKQLCRKCQKGFNPYRVEAIQCQSCSKTRCSCPQKKRHIDLKRPHRQELCGRCKNKKLSCDSTYSFKYII